MRLQYRCGWAAKVGTNMSALANCSVKKKSSSASGRPGTSAFSSLRSSSLSMDPLLFVSYLQQYAP